MLLLEKKWNGESTFKFWYNYKKIREWINGCLTMFDKAAKSGSTESDFEML